jgi:hypothetical protein
MNSPPFPLLIGGVYINPEHTWLEVASWIAQLIIAALAVVGAFFAWRQLGEMSDYRQQRLRIANATLLLELDHRFDSDTLGDARDTFASMREGINKHVSENNLHDNEEEKLRKVKAEWSARLKKMRNDNDEKYSQLILLGGFFETVGVMVKKNYVAPADALALFGGPIIHFGRGFSLHINERQNEANVPSGLLEHVLYFYDLAETDQAKRKSANNP